MTNAPKTVLAIHDLPGFGRAALSVIVPMLSTLGVQTVALPTAVLSTHTGGLGTPAKLANPGYGPAALEHYHRLGVKFDWTPRRQSSSSRRLSCGPARSRSWTRCWATEGGCTAAWGPTWCPLCIVCAARRI